jgi:hypothetical protein
MVAGNVADIVFGIQSSKGTAVVPTALNSFRCLVNGGWLAPTRDEAVLEETGTTRLRSQAFLKMVRAGGSPAFWARPAMLGALLYGAMGGKATTGSADPYTHTFTLGSTQPWMTFWSSLGAGSAIKFEQFVDCKLSSLKIESSAGNPIKVSIEVVGIAPTFETPYPPTALVAETVVPFQHADGKGTLLYEGAAASSIDTFTVTIGTGVTAAQGDGYTPDSVNEGMLDITVETGQIISDFALWNRLHWGSATPTDGATPSTAPLELGGSPAGLDFLFTRVGATPGPERSLDVKLPRLRVASIAGIEANTSGEPLRRNVTYNVLQPSGGVSGMTAILKNAQAAY